MHDNLRSAGPQAIIVMGVSGSGKSTLAAALAGALGLERPDPDERVITLDARQPTAALGKQTVAWLMERRQ